MTLHSNLQTLTLKSVTCAYLPVTDKLASSAWYTRHFGLRLKPKSMDDPKLGGGQNLFLLPVRDAGTTSNFRTSGWGSGVYSMFPVCFETNCIAELHERLRSGGVQVEALTDEGDCGYQFVYADPDGNRFLVWQDRHAETRPWEQGTPALSRIASIYLPVSDPRASLDWYVSHFNLSRNGAGQPVTEDGVSLFFLKTVDEGVTSNFYTTDWKPGGCEMAMFNFRVDNVRLLRQRLLDNGVTVSEVNDAGGCGLSVHAFDPDGNRLELWQRPSTN